jgi:hypothetical protein
MNHEMDGSIKVSARQGLLSFNKNEEWLSEITHHLSTRSHIVKRSCFCENISIPAIAY